MCPNDPLVFTCEVNDALLLRLILPTGQISFVSVGDNTHSMRLPAGFTADSLHILEIDNYHTRNFSLALSIENASLLNGDQITCDDTIKNKAMAECQLAGKPSV